MALFTLSSSMEEVETKLPLARSFLYNKFHLGGCASCGYEKEETILQVAQKHSKNPQEIVDTLNHSFAEMQKTEVSPQELSQLIAQGAPLTLLDVREQWEFDICHIPSSTRLTQENWGECVSRAQNTENVVLICHHGVRSMNATLYLKQNGVAQAKSLKGGIDAYSLQIDSQIPRY